MHSCQRTHWPAEQEDGTMLTVAALSASSSPPTAPVHLKQSPAHSSTDTGGYTWHTDHHWLQGGSSREVHSRDGAAAHSSTAEALLDNSSSPPHSAAAYLLPLGRKVTVTCTPSLCLLVIREYLRSRDYNLTHWWTRASAIWCVNILSK